MLTAEAGVFDMFSFPLLRGDPKTALARPYTMVLTEPLARRLFGDNDPIGQVVRYEERFDCEVTGIVGQPPASSLLQFSALLSFATLYEERAGTMGTRAFRTFVQLTPVADVAAIAVRIPGIVEATTGLQDAADSYALQPLKSVYFDTEVSSNVGRRGNPFLLDAVRQLGGGDPDDRRGQLREFGRRRGRGDGFTRSACARPSALTAANSFANS